MDILDHFMTYAAAFEESYKDDDWTRLYRYFTDDAVYEVVSDSMGCTLTGPERIFAGIKKSVDGFDRKFTGREIALRGAPEVGDGELDVAWTVTYTRDGVAPYVLPGRTHVRFRDGKIAHMSDAYEPSQTAYTVQWMKDNDMSLDGSYV